MKTKKLIKKWKKRWNSPIVPKRQIADFTGGLLRPQTLTNLTCAGKGPTPFYIRGKAVYDIDELLEWLLEHISVDYEGFEIRRETPNYKATA